MTSQETINKALETQSVACQARERYELATQAFSIACARRDWLLAEKAQQTALSAMAEHFDALQVIYRLRDAP